MVTKLTKRGETPFSLEGFYILVGCQLTKQQEQSGSKPFKILIRERMNPKGKKSKTFLSALLGKKHFYISSLYPYSKNAFKFEYKGMQYILSKKSFDNYVISKKEGSNE